MCIYMYIYYFGLISCLFQQLWFVHPFTVLRSSVPICLPLPFFPANFPCYPAKSRSDKNKFNKSD